MPRGRPKGSKNKPKDAVTAEVKEKRKRGRPVGSKNKPKQANIVPITVNTALIEQEKRRKTGRKPGQKSGYTVSEKALAQRQNNFMSKDPITDEEKDYNARLIGHIMQINEIRTHADKHDLLSLRSCFIAYLQLCQKNGFNVTNLSAYAAMGFDYTTFNIFAKRDDPEIREFCKFIKETCAMFRENMVANNKLNPVIGIFWQRNYDGLRNDTEQVQAAQEQEDENYGSNQSYKDKYKKLIGG